MLSAVLIASGIILITKGDDTIVLITAALVSLIFGALFTYILRREVKLPHGEGVRAYKLISMPWSRPHGNGAKATDDAEDSSVPTPTGYDPGFKD
jgi:hypothetical protein